MPDPERKGVYIMQLATAAGADNARKKTAVRMVEDYLAKAPMTSS